MFNNFLTIFSQGSHTFFERYRFMFFGLSQNPNKEGNQRPIIFQCEGTQHKTNVLPVPSTLKHSVPRNSHFTKKGTCIDKRAIKHDSVCMKISHFIIGFPP